MINEPTRLQIYPRGFLGVEQSQVIAKRETPFSQNYKQRQFSLSLIDTIDKKRLGDSAIDALFTKYIHAEGNINSHAFRERVFKNTFRLMNGKSFYFWYTSQRASPLLGDYQQRFLEDTLSYLITGKRSVSIQTWDSLLTFTTQTDEPTPDSSIMRDFFGERSDGTGEKIPKNRNIVDVLQLWWEKPAGVGDLLHTLHILFGNN